MLLQLATKVARPLLKKRFVGFTMGAFLKRVWQEYAKLLDCAYEHRVKVRRYSSQSY